MMLATGIVELRPFDGSGPIILLRMEAEHGTFDLPISVEQAAMLIQAMDGSLPEETQEEPQEAHTHQTPQNLATEELGFGGLKLAADEYEDDDGL